MTRSHVFVWVLVCACLLSVGGTRAAYPTAASLYLRSSHVSSWASDLGDRHSRLVEVFEAVDPARAGRKVTALMIRTRPSPYARSSHGGGAPEASCPPLRAVLVCGMHGREPVSVEVCRRIAERAVTRAAPSLPEGGGGTGGGALAEWVERGRLELLVVPLTNPSGNDGALSNSPCMRVNSAGVDLNRNWPRFGTPGVTPRVDTGPSAEEDEENPGPYPLSEYENAFVHRLVTAKGPSPSDSEALGFSGGAVDVLVNVHSGAEAILWPFDVTYAPSRYAGSLRALAERMTEGRCPRCDLSSGISAFYPAAGTLVDWAHHDFNVTVAYTWEVYSDPTASRKDCLRFFNPHDRETLDSVTTSWTSTFTAMIGSLLGSPHRCRFSGYPG